MRARVVHSSICRASADPRCGAAVVCLVLCFATPLLTTAEEATVSGVLVANGEEVALPHVYLWPEKQEKRILWDIALIHVMIDPDHGQPVRVPAPKVHDDGSTTDAPESPRLVTVYADIDAQAIYRSYWEAVAAADRVA